MKSFELKLILSRFDLGKDPKIAYSRLLNIMSSRVAAGLTHSFLMMDSFVNDKGSLCIGCSWIEEGAYNATFMVEDLKSEMVPVMEILES